MSYTEKDLETFEAFKANNPHLFGNGDLAKYGNAPKGELLNVDMSRVKGPDKVKPTTQAQREKIAQHVNKVKAMPKRIEYVYKKPDKKPLMPLDQAKREVWAIMLELMQAQGRVYKFDAYNRQLLAELTKYFTWQSDCQYNLDKGLWLFGPVGVGKTFLIEVFELFTTRHNLPTAFNTHNLKTIAGNCQGDGYKELYKYYQGFVCFDDVGIEDKVRYMGNSICCFTEIVTELYKRHTKSGKIAIATTNLFPESLGERYGERVEDRLKQLFTFVCLGGTSKR